MRIVGVDCGSHVAGFAVVIDGIPQELAIWKNDDKDAVRRLCVWADWFTFALVRVKPEIVVVEEMAMTRNANTVKLLSRFEGVTIYLAKTYGAIVLQHRVSEARKIVLGNGNTPKEEAYKQMRARYPDFAWKGPKSGGMDQADSLTMCLAAPQLAERR